VWLRIGQALNMLHFMAERIAAEYVSRAERPQSDPQ
jgi:hypothetical protein